MAAYKETYAWQLCPDVSGHVKTARCGHRAAHGQSKSWPPVGIGEMPEVHRYDSAIDLRNRPGHSSIRPDEESRQPIRPVGFSPAVPLKPRAPPAPRQFLPFYPSDTEPQTSVDNEPHDDRPIPTFSSAFYARSSGARPRRSCSRTQRWTPNVRSQSLPAHLCAHNQSVSGQAPSGIGQ